MTKRIALVTGASSGIGAATAIELVNRGFVVYGAARRVDQITTAGVHPLALDVTDEESMVNCVKAIIAKEGRIDVLVNNAGYGSFGAIEDVPMDEARRQVEVNLFGLARMIQLVLPTMRIQKFGKIVNISSMGGKVWTPLGGWYHATKFAVEGLSDCLRMELKPFGIDVIVIEPGGITTPFGAIAAENLTKVSVDGAYQALAERTAKSMIKNYSGTRLTKPEVIARCIAHAVTTKKPKTRYLLGFAAKPAVFIKNLLGDRVYDALIQKMM